MKKKVALLFMSFLNMFSLKENKRVQIIKLNANKKIKRKWASIVFPNSYVKAYLYGNVLEFEFYISSKDVVVSVLNPVENVIYREIISTVDTLHLMVNTKKWSPGIYTICISNINDISVFGNFFLEDDF